MVIIDFNDSFTYNLASELNLIGLETKVINYKNFKNINQGPILLGPGPGHINEYSDFLQKEIYPFLGLQKMIGICLGHQMLCSLIGGKIQHSKVIKHGRQEKISLNRFWRNILDLDNSFLNVQRYNSYTVSNLAPDENTKLLYSESDEIMGVYCNFFLSYQFHPESVGTTCRTNFMSSIKNYIL